MNINLHYALTQADYLEAQDVFTKHNGFVGWLVFHGLRVFGVLLIAATIFNSWSAPRNWPTFIFGIIWGALLIFGRKMLLSRAFAKEKSLQQPFDVRIDTDGIELSNQNGRTLSLWPAINKFVESQGLFLLFCNQRSFHAIPKRALTTPDADQFRELLQQKVRSKR